MSKRMTQYMAAVLAVMVTAITAQAQMPVAPRRAEQQTVAPLATENKKPEPVVTGKSIEVTFKGNNTRWGYLQEVGISSRPQAGDEIILNWIAGGGKPKPDSTWIIEQAEIVEAPLQAKFPSVPELVTEGRFVILNYTVENTQQSEITPPIPVLVDSQRRRFCPMSPSQTENGRYVNMPYYIPEGRVWCMRNSVAPGFKKSFCAIYEIPKAAVLKHVEIYPTEAYRFASLIRNGSCEGKAVDLPATANSEDAGEATGKTQPPIGNDEKISIFMTCKPKITGQTQQKTTYYSSTTTRTLTYSVDLRLASPQQRDFTLKTYFIASVGRDDVIVDVNEQDVSLKSGKQENVTVQSKDISERKSRYTSYSDEQSAKLKGVIIQLWTETGIVSSWASQSQWNQLAKATDIMKQMKVVRVYE